ncbi:helix-turn-helix domain-containing protein [Rouxiella sp. WC2420]|uniref:Helix-turn-helix domain-containing protein n=1 Tax=Rouxiella sp. WC2420 TaxID=3234145 RepID=A0AB39VUA7_9GAMM
MRHDDFYYDLCSWIENKLEAPLSLHEIAKKAGYSKWYLQRQFKSKMGVTLGKYIHNRRITRAALALRYSSLKISEIFTLSGFDSQQSFTRAFKRHFGITPAVYSHHEYTQFKGFQKLIVHPFTCSHNHFLTKRKSPLINATLAVRTNIETLININQSLENGRALITEFLINTSERKKFTMIANIAREDVRSHSILQELSLSAYDDPRLLETDDTVECLTFPFSGSAGEFLFFRSYVYYNLVPEIDISIKGTTDFFEGEICNSGNETLIQGCLYIPVGTSENSLNN